MLEHVETPTDGTIMILIVCFYSGNENCDAEMIIPTNQESCRSSTHKETCPWFAETTFILVIWCLQSLIYSVIWSNGELRAKLWSYCIQVNFFSSVVITERRCSLTRLKLKNLGHLGHVSFSAFLTWFQWLQVKTWGSAIEIKTFKLSKLWFCVMWDVWVLINPCLLSCYKSNLTAKHPVSCLRVEYKKENWKRKLFSPPQDVPVGSLL